MAKKKKKMQKMEEDEQNQRSTVKRREKFGISKRVLKIIIAFVVAGTMILGTAGTFLVYLFTQVFHK